MTETLYFTNRDQWRDWLKKNYKIKKDAWLVYYKKHTKKPTIPYDDAVEEAICFGWIDSTVNRIDEQRYKQRYTPRHIKSIWSESNVNRAKKMIKAGKMTGEGLVKYKKGLRDNTKLLESGLTSNNKLIIPEKLKCGLRKNKKAWKNFNNFATSYKKMYIFWYMDAKRDETRSRRMNEIIDRSEKNIRSGLR
ncbi:YdeI family protein [Actinomycetota bacterium]